MDSYKPLTVESPVCIAICYPIYKCSSKHGRRNRTRNEAALYLGIQHRTLLAYIAQGQLAVVHIESRQLIELEALKAYAEKRKPEVRLM